MQSNFLKKIVPYTFVFPALLLLAIFSLVPIVIALLISFTGLDITGLGDWSQIKFVGLSNYLQLFQDNAFLQSILNTVVYVVVGVPLVIIVSLTIAILINSGRNSFFKMMRLVFYTPSITNTVAVAVVWTYLYNPSLGLFNTLLAKVGIAPIGWLTDPNVAKLSLIILAVWKAVGLNMLIFLAALQGVPRSLYEAAELDGANYWEQTRHITLPSLKFSIFFVTVTTLIAWFQFFDEPFVMTKGGPLNSTNSVALFVYQNGFQNSNFGYAAAGSFVMFVAIIVATIIQFKLQEKQRGE
ncbi:carbohydrate ABC transporter permease [Liquorilactobacillus satsumensis]|uniref:Fructose-amino acid permease n=1 Tax=Liquorilactobacillus satsumensis DSM 16230 = JCM 12392 TaxID=1423801 RepID=A0A0R1UV08_9LACO|nr:sugar ABC transporter permease [Liquorilactobacillus satsumensis]KRL96991.1 fructose-amino acid permease [Liquorilactobacillus satsumensis DSM 16230 = JCM 12392]MCC7667162.1 sugar ABC transporter permease [Liquorilactobacillus satsumensis]MCP9329085.1 sugar ABC transporter permease [Liquorilactobacillus satsumensis]MCP9357755.1 sugar ABC transporter permease [Liquorilactobacillus satsumensis]MCP9371479.1 sugar ABC transporter permease [Liquorilactobacillus satsumensis]